MNERFQQAEALFHAALDFPPSQREQFLRAQTGTDDELLAQVQKLLEAEAASVAKVAATPAHLTRYGIYQTVGLLGRGGMGSVYLAERADGQYEQKVAVKVLGQHLGTDDFEARFVVERQLLAQLNHPNIVRLLDGGVSSYGEPYLVTEYVKGEALDVYCDAHKLGTRERITLFLQVCAAVEHAHQNLIVHRDLKPSNILVSESGQVKLLDFGTAKLLKSADAQIQTEVMLLTPRYASPEQLRKDPITTRSDVYSLGMILYELLSGKRPFGDGEAVQEMARAYQYVEASPLGEQFPVDLRAIAAKALEYDPARRYASVRDLSDDLSAFLASRPVHARPATTFYRAKKFVYRQRISVTAGLLVLLAGTAGLVGTLREKSVAERRFSDVRRLAHYQMFDLYDQMLEVNGTTKLRASISEEALRYLNSLAKESGGDPDLAVELALGYLRVGDVTGNFAVQSLGRWQDALDTYQKGIAVLAKVDSPAARKARAWLNFSIVNATYAAGANVDIAKAIDESIKEFEALRDQSPRDPESYLRLGKAYQAQARIRQNSRGVGGFSDRSEDLVRQAKDTFEKGLVYEAESKKLLQALHQLASERAAWIAQTKPQEALRWASEEEMWRLRLPPSLRTASLVVRDEAATISARGIALSALNDNEGAEAEMNKAVDIFEGLAKDRDNLGARMDLLSTLSNRGLLQYRLGKLKEYTASFERTLQIAEENLSPRFEDSRFKAMYNLAYAYKELSDPKAADFIPKAYEALKQRATANPKDLVSRVFLADMLLNLHYPPLEKPAEGLLYARQIVQIAPSELNGWELVAEAEKQQGHYPEAVAALEKGIQCVPAPKPGDEPSALYKSLTDRVAEYRAKI